jgi:hypothetical protein
MGKTHELLDDAYTDPLRVGRVANVRRPECYARMASRLVNPLNSIDKVNRRDELSCRVRY